MRAIFIDRDGTLNEEVGFITDPAQFRLFGFSAEAVRIINRAGWLAIVTTNQSGIARGLFTEDFLGGLHEKMQSDLLGQNARLDAIYFCPHHPDIILCGCRKPKPGLIERAARDFDLNLKECFVVGDRYIDVEMGHRASAKSVLVLTGKGMEEYQTQHEFWQRQPEQIAENLLEAVRWILNAY